jgi:hypothetical protein
MTPGEAAAWMSVEYVKLNRVLYQQHAAGWLAEFESGQTYSDTRGYLCVSEEALKVFYGLTANIVYDRGEKFWRERLPSDKSGRQQ